MVRKLHSVALSLCCIKLKKKNKKKTSSQHKNFCRFDDFFSQLLAFPLPVAMQLTCFMASGSRPSSSEAISEQKNDWTPSRCLCNSELPHIYHSSQNHVLVEVSKLRGRLCSMLPLCFKLRPHVQLALSKSCFMSFVGILAAVTKATIKWSETDGSLCVEATHTSNVK